MFNLVVSAVLIKYKALKMVLNKGSFFRDYEKSSHIDNLIFARCFNSRKHSKYVFNFNANEGFLDLEGEN